jgi:S-phase kinase-associated protein 1
MVKIITKDDVEIDVPNEIVTLGVSDSDDSDKLMGLFSTFIDNNDDDDDNDDSTPVDADSVMIKHVIDYGKLYAKQKMTIPEKPLLSYDMKDNVQECYSEFINKFTTLEVLQLIMTANYLEVKPLLSLAGSKIASLIKGKTSKEIGEVSEWITKTPIDKLAVELDQLASSNDVQN